MLLLDTPRLLLRDHTEDDRITHRAIVMDPATMDHMGDLFCRNEAEGDENFAFAMEQTAQSAGERRFYFLRMVRKEDGAHIGEAGFDYFPEETPARVHLGYFSWPKYWGNGYMTEAARALLAYAFETLEAGVATSGCLDENIGSYRVMEHCGMTRTDDGTLTEPCHGKECPRREYSITRAQWLAVQSAEK